MKTIEDVAKYAAEKGMTKKWIDEQIPYIRAVCGESICDSVYGEILSEIDMLAQFVAGLRDFLKNEQNQTQKED